MLKELNFSINDILKFNKDNILKFELVLISLVFIFSFSVGNISATYVDTINVNDSGGSVVIGLKTTAYQSSFSVKNLAVKSINPANNE